jgi:hypothetical protein
MKKAQFAGYIGLAIIVFVLVIAFGFKGALKDSFGSLGDGLSNGINWISGKVTDVANMNNPNYNRPDSYVPEPDDDYLDTILRRRNIVCDIHITGYDVTNPYITNPFSKIGIGNEYGYSFMGSECKHYVLPSLTFWSKFRTIISQDYWDDNVVCSYAIDGELFQFENDIGKVLVDEPSHYKFKTEKLDEGSHSITVKCDGDNFEDQTTISVTV